MFKKTFSLLTAAIMTFSLAACGHATTSSNEPAPTNESTVSIEAPESQMTESSDVEPSSDDGKILVAYFSWSGNTEEMASYIAEQTGGDLFEIEPETPYPDDYNETGDVAEKERDENARPEIANLLDSIEEYDSIFIGYPIWWHTAPMIIGTFLESYDLSGVDVYPFTQSASMDTEQFENSMEFVRDSAANATVHEGLFTGASNTEDIFEYLSSNGFIESASEAVSETESSSEETALSEEGDTSGSILIAYFSVPETDGVDTVAGASRVVVDGEVLGNNQYIAQLIQQKIGGDLFRIETEQEYPGSHDPLLEFAYNEKSDNARPVLSSQIENLDEYDVIFLGYPNWNSDLPMPLYSFLEEYDFSGKTIVPFTTHGGSGFSRTIRTIAEMQPGAAVMEDGLSISRNSVPDAQRDVEEWIAGLEL